LTNHGFNDIVNTNIENYKKIIETMKKLTVGFIRYFIYWLVFILGKIFSKILNQIEVSGKENIPFLNKGVCYFVNHRTIIDSVWVAVAQMNLAWMFVFQNRIPANAADSKNFFSSRIKKLIFSVMKCFPVNRNTNNIESMNNQVVEYGKVLEKQNLLLFFEGTRSRNGDINKCKYGPAKLVLLKYKSVKFIPVFLDDGISKIMPIREGKIFTRLRLFKKAKIVFGHEINFSDIIESDIEESKKIELIKERIRNSVLALKP
jgi:1-acyl-sn-glycerol-3-phosphate acyltransferase